MSRITPGSLIVNRRITWATTQSVVAYAFSICNNERAMNEQCVVCGTGAAVRVGGTSFCGSCGVKQFTATDPVKAGRRPRRAVWFSLLTSSLLLKSLLGAVAVAAVGGVAGAALQPAGDLSPATTTSTVVTTSAVVIDDASENSSAPIVVAAAEGPSQAEGDVSVPATDHDVEGFVAAIQEWADCVSAAASAHSGGGFDPVAACDEKPSPADYGIGNSENAPGHGEDGPGNSENAPGHGEDGPGNSENAPGQSDRDK